MHLLRLPQVRAMTTLSRTAIYDSMRVGAFPATVKLGPKHVAWRAGEIAKWLADPTGYRCEVAAA
ncbi:AlpA family phage regulatory protein [Paraburkholderia rhynchosiae]|nr:AlpA family phage regulatory protein [Paraburkholderia rhynchosiae]